MRPSEVFRETQAQEARQDAIVSEGVKFMSEDQACGDKEDMRPDSENSKLVRQGRMCAKDGSSTETSKTVKANCYSQTMGYLKGYDNIKWKSKTKRRRPVKRVSACKRKYASAVSASC